MRCLITVASYFPSSDGVQFVTSYLAEGLVKKGHSVTVVTKVYDDFPNSNEIINGVTVTRFSAYTEHMYHKGDKKSFWDYILSNQDNFDVMINVSTQAPFTDWLLPIIDKIKIPKVLHLHSVWEFKFRKTDFESFKSVASKALGYVRWGWYFLTSKGAFRKYDAVLQLHEKDYGYVFFKKHYGIDSIVLENAAEDAFFDIEGVEKEKVILNVSNFYKRKNQLECIKVFEKSNLSEDWKLVLIGSKNTSYYRELKAYCENTLDPSKRDRVILRVGVPRDQIAGLVKSSSIYMMTSTWEAFPISILEAMAAGVPYISSDVGIVKYLGGGVVPKTQDEFVQSLERLASDDEYRIGLGEEGRKEACEKYKISKKVDQLEAILYSLLRKE